MTQRTVREKREVNYQIDLKPVYNEKIFEMRQKSGVEEKIWPAKYATGIKSRPIVSLNRLQKKERLISPSKFKI